MDISQTGDISGDISCLKLALHAGGAQRSICMIGDISKLEIYLEISCLNWHCTLAVHVVL